MMWPYDRLAIVFASSVSATVLEIEKSKITIDEMRISAKRSQDAAEFQMKVFHERKSEN